MNHPSQNLVQREPILWATTVKRCALFYGGCSVFSPRPSPSNGTPNPSFKRTRLRRAA